MGNSILIKERKGKYIYIGERIASFQLQDDDIVEYLSPIGNNDVPYPYAKGIKYTYLMIEKIKIPNEKLHNSDPYRQYYDYQDNPTTPNVYMPFHKQQLD